MTRETFKKAQELVELEETLKKQFEVANNSKESVSNSSLSTDFLISVAAENLHDLIMVLLHDNPNGKVILQNTYCTILNSLVEQLETTKREIDEL